MTLRHRRDCVESHSVLIALGLKGMPCRLVELPASRGRSILDPDDPGETSPHLIVEGAHIQRAIPILEYLDEIEGEFPLLPGAAVDRARVRALAQACATCFSPATCVEVGKHAAWLADSGSNVRLDWVRTFLRRGFSTMESLLDDAATGRFCHGDEPGMADCMLIPHFVLAQRVGAGLEAFPRTLAIGIRCSSELAFAAAATGGNPPAREPDALQD